MSSSIELSGIDTSDATATAAKILSGFTAYAKGNKVTGNYVPPTVSFTNIETFSGNNNYSYTVQHAGFAVIAVANSTSQSGWCDISKMPYDSQNPIYSVGKCKAETGGAHLYYSNVKIGDTLKCSGPSNIPAAMVGAVFYNA